VQFNEDAELDTSQVSDMRGVGGRVAVGGGGLGIVGLIIYFVLSQMGGGAVQLPTGSGFGDVGQNTQVDSQAIREKCRTGADANRADDCRAVAFINSIQAYWSDQFARSGRTYQAAKTNFFQGGVRTGCGSATSASGPFYCPADSQVYIDLAFFQELKTKFGAEGGPFVEAYVLAHEYGHHVQHLLGGHRPAVGLGAAGAPGGLLRGRLGEPRHHDADRVRQAAHHRRDRRRRERRPGRRRAHR
jgi:predicted metalloprotease